MNKFKTAFVFVRLARMAQWNCASLENSFPQGSPGSIPGSGVIPLQYNPGRFLQDVVYSPRHFILNKKACLLMRKYFINNEKER